MAEFFGEIVLGAVLLCALMYFLAQYEAEYSFPYVLILSAGLTVAHYILAGITNPWFAIVPMVVLSAFALQHFCLLKWKKGFIVGGTFVLVSVIYRAIVQFVVEP